MDNSNIKIQVSGVANSGKSRITHLLKNFLVENGFEVEQELTLDFPTEQKFDNHMKNDIDIVVEHLAKTKKIILSEEQLKRDGTSV